MDNESIIMNDLCDSLMENYVTKVDITLVELIVQFREVLDRNSVNSSILL